MDCPTPSHIMWCFFVVCLHFFWIDYRIIEFIGQLSFCKKRDFMMGILKKNGACFFFFFVGVQEKRNIYFSKKEKKKEKKEVVIRICSYFIGFTGVYIHTFMLKCRLYNT